MTDQEFIIVVRASSTGFRYSVYLVQAGHDHRSLPREYVTGTDSLWGARRAIRKERRRLTRGAEVVHREPR